MKVDITKAVELACLGQNKSSALSGNGNKANIDRSAPGGFYAPGRRTPVPAPETSMFRSIKIAIDKDIAAHKEPVVLTRIETHPPFVKEFKSYPHD